MNEYVVEAVSVFRSFPEYDDEEVFRELITRGVPRRVAARLVELVPSAYCRVLLRESGVTFSHTFTRPCCGDEARLLSSEAAWVDAMSYADAEIGRAVSKDDLLRVAGRSAEFQAINQLLQRGSKLASLVLTPIALPWPEEGPPQTQSGDNE